MNRGDREIGLHKTMLRLGRCDLPTRHGDFAVHFFRDLASERTAMAIVCGSLGDTSPLLARVHSSCLTSECLMGRDCDCAEQLDGALARMADAGEGVLFYLMQEGRGAGLTAKARDRMIVQASGNRMTTFEAYAEMGLPPDLRRYEAVAAMARLLGLRAPLRLLTNNPEKAAAVAKTLADENIEVCSCEPIQGPTSAFNSDYLSAKHDSGHAINRPAEIMAALPPGPVQRHAPMLLAGGSTRFLTASYFLPVALSDCPGAEDVGDLGNVDDTVDWFRLSVIFDSETGLESIVLAHPHSALDEVVAEAAELFGRDAGDARITMSLLDRLPAEAAPGREALTGILLAIREAGRGLVAIDFDDRPRAAG